MSEAAVKDRGVEVKDDTETSGLHLADNAERVLRARYLLRDEQGRVTESPETLFRRVAGAIAEAELLYDSDTANRSEWEQRFYSLMVERRFMPNSPTLMNAATPLGMLSACFVLPVPDSMEGIMDAAKHMALVQQAGGGTGFSASPQPSEKIPRPISITNMASFFILTTFPIVSAVLSFRREPIPAQIPYVTEADGWEFIPPRLQLLSGNPPRDLSWGNRE